MDGFSQDPRLHRADDPRAPGARRSRSTAWRCCRRCSSPTCSAGTAGRFPTPTRTRRWTRPRRTPSATPPTRWPPSAADTVLCGPLAGDAATGGRAARAPSARVAGFVRRRSRPECDESRDASSQRDPPWPCSAPRQPGAGARRRPHAEPRLRAAPAATASCAASSTASRTPLVRWHYHDEYELHLISATRGKVFVGDWIGQFEPGHLVLTGPRLPHNWISIDVPEGGVALRDLVLQFARRAAAPGGRADPRAGRGAAAARARAPRHRVLRPVGARARALRTRVKAAHGLQRFAEFCALPRRAGALHRLPAAVHRAAAELRRRRRAGDQINGIVDRITEHYAETLLDGRPVRASWA